MAFRPPSLINFSSDGTSVSGGGGLGSISFGGGDSLSNSSRSMVLNNKGIPSSATGSMSFGKQSMGGGGGFSYPTGIFGGGGAYGGGLGALTATMTAIQTNQSLLEPIDITIDPNIQIVRTQEKDQIKGLNNRFADLIDKVSSSLYNAIPIDVTCYLLVGKTDAQNKAHSRANGFSISSICSYGRPDPNQLIQSRILIYLML